MANWSGYAINLAVMFFLSPMVFKGLGKNAYGVWSLLMTITGYLGLAEIGVRVSTGRFLNFYIGKKDDLNVCRVINTSLIFYTAAGIVVFAASVTIAFLFEKFFPDTPVNLISQVRVVMLMMAINVWLGFIASVFGQLLESRNRFDLRAVTVFITLLIRAVGTIYVLKTTVLLTHLAAVLVLSSAAGLGAIIAMNRFWGLRVKLARSFIKIKTLREVFGYGLWAFVQNMSTRIISYTDIVIIAMLIDMENVAVYSVATMLLHSATDFTAHIFRVIAPDLAKIAGRNDMKSLRKYVFNSTRVTLLVVVPIYTILMMWGGEFVNLWMGKGLEQAGKILLILGIAHLAGMMRWAVTLAIKTIGYVKITAIISMGEAIGNLIFSLWFLLGLGWGIYGIAAGVVVPSLLIGFAATVLIAKKLIGITLQEITSRMVVPAIAGGLIFAVVCETIRFFISIDNWPGFFTALIIAVVLYIPIAFFILLNGNHREYLARNFVLLISRRQEAKR